MFHCRVQVSQLFLASILHEPTSLDLRQLIFFLHVKIVSVLLLAFLDWFSRKQIYFAAIGGRIAVSSQPPAATPGSGEGQSGKVRDCIQSPISIHSIWCNCLPHNKIIPGFHLPNEKGGDRWKGGGVPLTSKTALYVQYCSSIKHIRVDPETIFIWKRKPCESIHVWLLLPLPPIPYQADQAFLPPFIPSTCNPPLPLLPPGFLLQPLS